MTGDQKKFFSRKGGQKFADKIEVSAVAEYF
jgi:hypothetical protein